MIKPLSGFLFMVCLLPGCQAGLSEQSEPDVVRTPTTAPPGAEPGTCWGKQVSPAVVETVTEQILLQPADRKGDGTATVPATYKTETRQVIVKERRKTWFEAPCDDVQTPEFIATLQRALMARGFYHGTISGEMDMRTRTAIRRYQAPGGLDSGILSMATARKLGLVAVHRADN